MNKETPIKSGTAKNLSYPKKTTKKLARRDGISWLIIGLVFAALAGYFVYQDYRAQRQHYNIFVGAPKIDFNTGKRLESQPSPPPFEYSVGINMLLPVLFGSIGLLFLAVAISSLIQAAKTIETAEMRAIDVQREALENSPEIKSYARQQWILYLSPFALMTPVPFIAIYKLGASVFAVYMLFVAIVVGALYVILPRRMSKRN